MVSWTSQGGSDSAVIQVGAVQPGALLHALDWLDHDVMILQPGTGQVVWSGYVNSVDGAGWRFWGAALAGGVCQRFAGEVDAAGDGVYGRGRLRELGGQRGGGMAAGSGSACARCWCSRTIRWSSWTRTTWTGFWPNTRTQRGRRGWSRTCRRARGWNAGDTRAGWTSGSFPTRAAGQYGNVDDTRRRPRRGVGLQHRQQPLFAARGNLPVC